MMAIEKKRERYPSFYVGLLSDDKTVKQYNHNLDTLKQINPHIRIPNRKNPHISLFYGSALGEEEFDLVFSAVVRVDQWLKDETVRLEGVRFGSNEKGLPNIIFSVLQDPRPLREAHYLLKEELSPFIEAKYSFPYEPHMTWAKVSSDPKPQEAFHSSIRAIERILNKQRWQFSQSGVFLMAEDRDSGFGSKHCLAASGSLVHFQDYTRRFERQLVRAS